MKICKQGEIFSLQQNKRKDETWDKKKMSMSPKPTTVLSLYGKDRITNQWLLSLIKWKSKNEKSFLIRKWQSPFDLQCKLPNFH